MARLIDKGLTDIKTQMFQLRRWVATIGVQGKEAARRYKRSGLNVATVATIQEFGTGASEGHAGIPARSFIRGALFANKEALTEFIADEMVKVFQGKSDALTANKNIGKFAAKLVKARIDTTFKWAKANAAATVARKGFNFPLHETDRLSKSISWAVRDGGKDGAVILRGKAR